MIHISIPTHRTLTDPDDPFNKYTVFDIHVNGSFHAGVRYNLLYSLHERLISTFGFRLQAPEFPPKKIWKLDSKSLNERREGLAKYLQGVIANPDVARHIILEKSFLEFQVKSFSSSLSRIVKLEILLPDGRPVFVECCSDDPTNAVMEKFCRVVVMSEVNSKFFGLFLARPRYQENASGSAPVHFNMLCVRWLKNFESPFISQQMANRQGQQEQLYRILVQRTTWDPSVEEPLLDDPGSLKVIYLQALNDIRTGLLKLAQEVKEKLTALQEFGDFKQFVRLCHLQPEYGYSWLGRVRSDFPQEDAVCELKVGRRQLLFECLDQNGTTTKHRLSSKRIRVWRVSHSESQPQIQMSFQLEFLLGADHFREITLHMDSTLAVMLSLFLQSIADEILQSRDRAQSPCYKFDDNISLKAAELLETAQKNSIVADDLSIKSCCSSSVNGIGAPEMDSLSHSNGHGQYHAGGGVKLISVG